MKKIFCVFVLVFLVFGFSGCSSNSHYIVKPTPLKSGKSLYVIESLELELHEDNKNPENNNYLNQEELRQSFLDFMTEHLKQENIYGDEYKLNIKMQYDRMFYFGGNSVVTPQFIYSLEIFDKDNNLLVAYSIPKSTIKRSFVYELAYNTQKLVGQWDHEDEPKDVEFMAKTIVKEIKELGK